MEDEITSVKCQAQTLPVVLEGLKQHESLRAANIIRAIELFLENHDVTNVSNLVEIGDGWIRR